TPARNAASSCLPTAAARCSRTPVSAASPSTNAVVAAPRPARTSAPSIAPHSSASGTRTASATRSARPGRVARGLGGGPTGYEGYDGYTRPLTREEDGQHG